VAAESQRGLEGGNLLPVSGVSLLAATNMREGRGAVRRDVPKVRVRNGAACLWPPTHTTRSANFPPCH
jgi:hypothetical protein